MHYPAIFKKISKYQIDLQAKSKKRTLLDIDRSFQHNSLRKQTRRHPRGGSRVDERDNPELGTDRNEYGHIAFWPDDE